VALTAVGAIRASWQEVKAYSEKNSQSQAFCRFSVRRFWGIESRFQTPSLDAKNRQKGSSYPVEVLSSMRRPAGLPKMSFLGKVDLDRS